MISWSARRQINFIFYIALIALVGAAIFYFVVVKQPISCGDGVKNQDELGIDCGGTCARVCQSEVVPITVRWARALKVRDGFYDLAAFIENKNVQFVAKKITYSFKLYDQKNLLILEKRGTTSLNPGDLTIEFNPNVDAGLKIPNRVFFDISNVEWERIYTPIPKLNISFSDQSISNDGTPRVAAKVSNYSPNDYGNVQVIAALYDETDNVVGVSATYINALHSKETRDIVFTWPGALSPEPVSVSFYPMLYSSK